jgi:hypothetical protein
VVVYAKLILQDRLIKYYCRIGRLGTFGGCVVAVRHFNIRVQNSSIGIWVE